MKIKAKINKKDNYMVELWSRDDCLMAVVHIDHFTSGEIHDLLKNKEELLLEIGVEE